MPRKGENIYKRKDGRWEGRYIKNRDGKKAVYGYVYAKTYSDVKKKLLMKKTDALTALNIPNRNESKDASFSEISDLWLIAIRSSIKESTRFKYRNSLKKHIAPKIGKIYISKIDYELTHRMCNKLLETGGKTQNGLSNKTVSDILSILKAVIKYAERLKYNIDRTALDVSIKIKMYPLRVLSKQEEQILFNKLTDDMGYTELGVLISMFTGIRIGELCAMR